MFDAFMTAEIIAQDAVARPAALRRPEPDLQAAIGGSRRIVSWTDWRRIDDEERRRGQLKGKTREKMTSVEEMLRFLD
jgi:adrenodoxin-NADP+ reductase